MNRSATWGGAALLIAFFALTGSPGLLAAQAERTTDSPSAGFAGADSTRGAAVPPSGGRLPPAISAAIGAEFAAEPVWGARRGEVAVDSSTAMASLRNPSPKEARYMIYGGALGFVAGAVIGGKVGVAMLAVGGTTALVGVYHYVQF